MDVVACESLGTLPPLTTFGPRWNPAAYASWSGQVDSELQRSDFITDPTGTLAVTRSFQMPFLTDQSASGCKSMTAQVKLPNPALPVVTRTISCPTTPYADMTSTVATALAQLAQQQQTDAASGTQDALELRFQTPCTYYFIPSGNAAITIPAVTDLTITAGTSLADAATLVVAQPLAATVSSFSSSIYLLDTNATPAPDGFLVGSGGQRIQLTNLKLQAVTPPIINSVTRWDLLMPFVDFGSISADPDNQGQNILTVTPNNAGDVTVYNPNYRQVVATDPSSPEDLLTTAPSTEIGNLANATYSASGSSLVATSTTLAKLPIGPVKIIHDTGSGSTAFAFHFSEPDDAHPVSDVSLVNVGLSDWDGIVFSTRMTNGLLLENFQETPSGAHHRTAAGGGLISGQIEGDVIVENSVFEYGGDDDVNLRSDLASLATAPSFDGTNTSFQINGKPQQNLQVGTKLCFLSPTYDWLLCTAIVALATSPTTIAVAGDQTALLQNGDLFFRSDRSQLRDYFVGDTFMGNRARGIVMKVADVYIAHNTFSHTEGPGVLLQPENDTFTEGPTPRNVVIAGNMLVANAAGLAYGAIASDVGANGTIPYTQTIQNVLIEDNTFGTEISPVVFTSSSGDVVVRSNTYQTGDLSLYAAGKFWQKFGVGYTLSEIVSLDP